MKSFKLGLPSLFGRKKSSALAQKASVKEEVLTRNSTIPTNQMEVEQMDLVFDHVNTMVGAEEVEVFSQEVEMQDTGKSARASGHNTSLELPIQAADTPSPQLTSCPAVAPSSPSPSLTAAAPTTQLLPGILPTDSKQPLLLPPQPSQELSLPPPVPTHKLSSAQPTAAVSTLQHSTHPLPHVQEEGSVCQYWHCSV